MGFQRDFDVEGIAPVEPQACADDNTDEQVEQTSGVELKRGGHFAAQIPELDEEQESGYEDKRATCEDHGVIDTGESGHKRYESNIKSQPDVPAHGGFRLF